MPPKRKSHPAGRAPNPPSNPDTSTVYFYLPNAKPYGVFCQWHPSPFTIPTSSLHFLTTSTSAPASLSPTQPTAAQILATYAPAISFTCTEQSLMFSKALFFRAPDVCARIMATADPARHKRLGRGVPSFSEREWGRVKSRAARVGNWYKFTDARNGGMRRVLVGTGGSEIVEASRRDRVWGVGYGEGEAERCRAFWGENLLGRCLGDVRGRIRGRGEAMERERVEWGEWDGGMSGDEGEVKVDGEDGGEKDGDVEDGVRDPDDSFQRNQ